MSANGVLVFDDDTKVEPTVVDDLTADFMVIDPPKVPARLVLDGHPIADFLVLTSGGPPGPPGPAGPAGDGGGTVVSAFEYAMPTPQTTAVVNHSLGRDPVAVQVVVDGVQASEFEVVFTVPNEQIRVGFDIPVAALIRLF